MNKKDKRALIDTCIMIADFMNYIILGALLLPFTCTATYISNAVFGKKRKRGR